LGKGRATLRVREYLKQRPVVHIAFEISIFFKGLDGVLQIVGGLLLFFVKPETISRIVIVLTQHELSEDPNDIIASYLVRLAHDLSATQVFAGVYLLSHGVIKVFLVESLLRRRLWAYPTGIVFFALFIVYQMYRYYLHPSIEMLVLSILDLIVIVLTWLEYRQLKRGEHDVWGVPSRRRRR
jgi:uncharacterized membrane protein